MAEGVQTSQREGVWIKHFKRVQDPRRMRNRRHELVDILVIAVCAVICGADDWVEVALFGTSKESWFKTFLALPHGIPSHDTFRRVFGLIKPEEFQQGFMSWVSALVEMQAGEVVAVDGKTLRRSYDSALGQGAIHMVSAWASANRLVLGQVKVAEKSNEITAIPALLRMLALEGCVVTIDAMGCQEAIVHTIVEQKADYVLAVKENQPTLYDDVKLLFDSNLRAGFAPTMHDHCRTIEKGHGRIEIRECWTLADSEEFLCLRTLPKWSHLHTLALVQTTRKVGKKTSTESRYFISSLPNDARQVLAAVRAHWGIENRLHWSLDIAFREDESRLRKDFGAQNFAVLRHLALNLLKHDTSLKAGLHAKRLKAGWDPAFLLHLLSA